MNIVHELDATGLACPMPLLKAKLALNELEPDQALKVHTTDKGSIRDFKTYAELSGQNLISSTEADGIYTFVFLKV
jgi:tRNA 2-thiouridine synthesizing protein A